MHIKSKIESLLFISAKPMSLGQIADLIKKKKEDVKKAGDDLVEEYKEKKRGIQIIKNGSKYQMVSSPENADLVQEFIKDETTGELSRPSLEALTIVAYRGPVSKIDLDRIRGVNCALILRNLLLRGLIEGKFNKEKQETYYTVTLDFMRFLGISDVGSLPDFEKLNKDDTISRFLDGEKDEVETELLSDDLTKDKEEKEEIILEEVKIEIEIDENINKPELGDEEGEEDGNDDKELS